MTAAVLSFPAATRELRYREPQRARGGPAAYVRWRCFVSARLIPAGLTVACITLALALTFALGLACGWV